jgi:hypothetical protein
MAKHFSCAQFKVVGGQVALDFGVSNSLQRVVVENDGTIVNKLKFGQNTVEHLFAIQEPYRFVEFKLKDFLGKPGSEDFEVQGHQMVDGVVKFADPVQSFMLINQNRASSSFQYGFQVQHGRVVIDYDPAVRNVGNPHVQINPMLAAFLAGMAMGALVLVVGFALLRLAGQPGP